ncbi:MAG: CDP-diacylglycerol--glycerol-3-phosphate 3-phosphatidyltransferase [Phycisphaerales bacterium]
MRKQIPNQLTIARLFLAAGFFFVLGQYRYEEPPPVGDPQTGLLFASLALFLIAAATDALDGYLARKWKAESLFGRVIDPVADKILIIGAFMFLAGPRFVIPEKVDAHAVLNMVSGVYPWMVVVILLRELLVTSIRAALESQGIDFRAKRSGKWKMILQAVAIPAIIIIVWLDPIAHPALGWTRDILVYLTVIVTITSGVPYVFGARKAMAEVRKGNEGIRG